MLRTQPFAGQRGINHQRVVSMDKGLFAPASRRVVPRQQKTISTGSTTCARASVSWGSCGLKPFRRRQRATRRGGDGADARLILQQPE
jgi:hypothetical protein